MIEFKESLRSNHLHIRRERIEIMQINLGKKCNLACNHCHVEASPTRTESMNQRTALEVIRLIENTSSVHTVDLTGGAPELNENFKKIVKVARKSGKRVIDRCNLTVFFEPGCEELPLFLKENQVDIVASLPCYSKENVENQRGRGVFNKSIEALRILNHLGYGVEGAGFSLDLVYNPGGAFLPPNQKKLEIAYKKEMKKLFNIEFNNLLTLTNLPIKRFNEFLIKSEKLEDYMQLLYENFNPQAAKSVMCKNLVSISWDGKVYDCDFNQMLELYDKKKIIQISEIDTLDDLSENEIIFANHCYGCTAGAGSSCSGSLTN